MLLSQQDREYEEIAFYSRFFFKTGQESKMIVYNSKFGFNYKFWYRNTPFYNNEICKSFEWIVNVKFRMQMLTSTLLSMYIFCSPVSYTYNKWK